MLCHNNVKWQTSGRNSHYEKFQDGRVVCIDDEIPFEIPQGWSWIRLRMAAEVARGGSPRPIKEYLTESTKGVNWIKIGDTEKGGKYINGTRERIIQEGVSKSRIIHKGDFLLTNSMSFGRPYISNIDGCIHDGWLVISPAKDSYSQDFLFYLLSSRFAYDQFCGKVSGAVVQNLNSDKVAEAIIPIPPLAEQKRIVAFLDKILPLVEKYGSVQGEQELLNATIKSKLRKSILQEAIQGHLIPQDPTDEPASILLEHIRVEKLKLLKEGKLKKKDIIDSVIYKGEDNKYYETIAGNTTEIEVPCVFPGSWEIVRLQSICALLDGEKKSGDAICLDAKFLRGKSMGDHLQSGKYVRKGDNIILVDGENSGEVFAVPIDGYMGSTFKQLWISESLYIPYVIECIRFYKDELKNSKKGAAIPHLNKDIFRSLIIGVPPINEQRRIVDRIQDIYKNLQG